jgi:hypothetical protein
MLRDAETMNIVRILKLLGEQVALGNLPGLTIDFETLGIDRDEYRTNKPSKKIVLPESEEYRYLTDEEWQALKEVKDTRQLAECIGCTFRTLANSIGRAAKGTRMKKEFIKKIFENIIKLKNCENESINEIMQDKAV